MDWTKRKWTNGKIELFPQLLVEDGLTLQKSIATLVYDHEIPSDLFINFDKTHLSYVSPGKYAFNLKGTINFPIKGADDKRQIMATFDVSATGTFLPMQLIYTAKTKHVCQIMNFHVVSASRAPKFQH